MIEIIDKDTVKITTERIVDLRPLKQRLIDIETELKNVEKEEDKILMENDRKFRDINELQSEKEDLKNKLSSYGYNI